MKNIKKSNAFTLIELLAVIVILAVIALIATPIILGIISDSKMQAFKDSAYGISQAAKNAYVEIMYAGAEPKDITYRYKNGLASSNPNGYTLKFNGQIPQNGEINLNKQGQVSLMLHDGKWCATKDYDDAEVTIAELSLADCVPQIVDESGANAPVLAAGMTAVRWDGSAWVNATNTTDIYKQNWYDYGEQKWANAKTADGSFWVWIPRFAYQIQSNYHTSTAGTIDVVFLTGTTDTPANGATITLGATPTYSGSAQTNHVKPSSFWWDNDSDNVQDAGEQLTGFWVAKFEPSGTSTALDSKPNVSSYRNIIGADMFNYTRNMETNSRYGWGTSGVGIDTHMMKNKEWGAVAYLSKSIYGKTGEVTPNTSSSYYTGGGTGDAYVTNVGQSTTGNIYGIYDMAGGGEEYVMGNYTDRAGSSGLTPASIANKYIDRYSVYYDAANFGDAVYETSSGSLSATSWYADHSVVSTNPTSNPWFTRGYYYGGVSDSGMFAFDTYGGGAHEIITWRISLVVGTGY